MSKTQKLFSRSCERNFIIETAYLEKSYIWWNEKKNMSQFHITL